jgi:hypothetical protein
MPCTPVYLSPRRVLVVLAGVAGTLLALHLAFAVGSAATGHPLYYLPRLFDLGQEANIPTFVAGVFLLAAAGLLAYIALSRSARSIPVS